MTRTLVLCGAVLAASMSGSYAGPCSQDIDRLRVEIDAKLGALAAAGPTAQESTTATMHRQPTPRSIAAAENKLGGLSPQKAEAVTAAMDRARATDRAGDQKACKQALADAKRELGR